ncbi:hypothetical protein HK103_006621 [Boothiomyces macroporosus]|uniref:SigF-like NTF2-like domain-containing protein n=1 Tax=Boothiomyces macroporosus TaxID=261099 RepID=A0AAD5UDJ9_9FUNG|nr:hypothetical protein HK103_006621 [Boothiomyces macroporosus]KAJ3312859.1 hypothetical protein HDV04_002669 [Boothiomyces sp. JEL0838]
MDKENLTQQVRDYFTAILSVDQEKQREAIEKIYEEDCHLQNPYLALQGREEIIRSYNSLAKNNMELGLNIGSISYDNDQQLIMADVQQLLKPKALGGTISINMHYILKLQLEHSDDGLFRIVDQVEIQVAQDLISQMPIIGSWYDSTIRNAVGQISLAGTSLLDYSGFLDFAPKAVDATKSTAHSIRQGLGSIASKGIKLGGSVVAATGVPSLLGGLAGYAKWGAAALIEEGQHQKIDCYSPSCTPGTICYSPTCPRGQAYSYLSKDAITQIVKGAYTGAAKTTSYLTTRSKHDDVPMVNLE